MASYLILTEECPQLYEVRYITSCLGLSWCATGITPTYHQGGAWTGSFLIDGLDATVILRLVKGSGSFMDYMVYDTLEATPETEPVLCLESTKTISNQSGNALYQRFTKLMECRLRFPNARLIHLTTGVETSAPTKNQVQQRRLFATHGFELVDGEQKSLLEGISPYQNADELVEDRKSCKAGSVVKVGDHHYLIRQPLSNGKNKTISSDPGKGAVISVANTLFYLDPQATFQVVGHGVELESLKATDNKFWAACRKFDLRLDGSEVSSLGKQEKATMWKSDACSEKNKFKSFA